MCGIIAYKGKKDAVSILKNGLKRLEYRGYDSVGISVVDKNKKLHTIKQTGCIDDLEIPDLQTNIGIGHTRWATHGRVCARNSHPHTTFDSEFSLVHNGIIENYKDLKKNLEKKYKFLSDTDSEVFLYLIYDTFHEIGNLYDAIKVAVERIVGAYSIVILERDKPDNLICVKKGSGLCIGVEDDNYFIASDSNAFSEYTHNIINIQNGFITKISGNNIEHYDSNVKNIASCNIEKVYNNTYEVSKENYSSFMLKEIFEQPNVISECLLGRIDGYKIKLGGFEEYKSSFKRANRLILLGCGSSYHSALLGKYYIEEISGLAVDVEYASEFRYRNPVINKNDIVMGISQSGETADTLAALGLAKDKGAIIGGICNTVNSELTKLTEFGIYVRCGIEVGVASTKAFTNQSLCFLLLALWIDQNINNTNSNKRKKIINEIKDLPILINKTLKKCVDIRNLSEEFSSSKNCLFLGRRYNYPIALEGALKLKEISYIHAEGYPAAEMKHGPIALIDENMPVVVLANNSEQYEKIINNKIEIESRNGKVIAVISENNNEEVGSYNIRVPSCDDIVTPFVSVIPLQLFSLYCAEIRGCNVDKPRNLAKSVTVE
jgi:glutamine---fructose-6-phosphate transaminase (isomerizing)